MGRGRGSGGRGPGAVGSYASFLTQEAATAWGEKHYRGWAESLDQDERDDFYLVYTASGYEWINKTLRSGADQSASFQKRIAEMDGALARTKTPEAVRGVRYVTSNVLAGHAEGSVFEDRGYGSVSLRQNFVWSGGHRCEILIPKGYRAAALIRGVSSRPSENEILLRRGTRYRIVHHGEGTFADPTILQVLPAGAKG